MADDRDPTRELLEARLEAIRAEFRTELSAMAKALALAEEYPTAIDKAVGHLKELHGERFASLERLFEEQRQAEAAARDKAEESMSAQLRQLEHTHESRNETTRTMLNGLKESVTRIEGGRIGANAMWGWVFGVASLIVAALAAC